MTNKGTETVTEIVDVEVEEHQNRVEIIVWTRDKAFEEMCAGVGVMLDSQAELSSHVGDRSLLDGGTVPATHVGGWDTDFTHHVSAGGADSQESKLAGQSLESMG